jgi:hypothetical protein
VIGTLARLAPQTAAGESTGPLAVDLSSLWWEAAGRCPAGGADRAYGAGESALGGYRRIQGELLGLGI